MHHQSGLNMESWLVIGHAGINVKAGMLHGYSQRLYIL